MRDSDTASIYSNASYVSSAPSYRSSVDPPPYSADGRLPSYSSSHSPLGASTRSPASSSVAPRGLPPIPRINSGLPPVALITPGSRISQSRQYQAVAARRQAKQAKQAAQSLYNPEFSSRVFPRDRPIRQNAPGLTFDTYSSLQPVLSARHSSRAHSTAELFLCTCGRPNHGKDSVSGAENHVVDPRAPRTLHNSIFDEPSSGTRVSSTTTPQFVATTEQRKTDDINRVSKLNDTEISEDEDDQELYLKDKEEDLLDTEGRSWDFMMSQM